jgi:tetratricopeptide (TPR) repeat protein
MAPGVITAHQPEALEIPLRGREQELEQLKTAIRSNRVVVVGGWAGVGKTTLGRCLAGVLQTPQVGIWVDCKRGMGLESLINALANLSGAEYEGFAYILKENLVKNPDQAVAALVRALDHGDNVLFLDDFHLVTDRHIAHDLAKALRLTTERARTVILTRELDKLKDALASKHAQVTYCEELVLADLDRRASLELLRDRGLGDWSEADLGRLYKKTRGHPQGLELCAGLLLDGMPIEDIERMPLFQRSGDEERSLRRVLQETEKRVSPGELHLLRRCSVFDEPFDERAMATVCPMEECAQIAEKVERRFLLSRRNGRYDLHPLVREYFYDRLKDDAPLVHGLAGRYYLGEVERITNDSERLALRMKAHGHFELAKDRAQLVALFPQVFDPLETTCRWAQARRICELTLDASRFLKDRKTEAQCLGDLGIICDDQGEPKEAVAYHQQALAISREVGDRRGERGHLGDLGNAYAHLGQVEEAIQCYQQSLRMAIDAGDRKMEGWNLGNLGLAYAVLKELEKAIGYYQEALIVAREIGDRRAEVNHLNNLGMASADLDRPEKAVECYQQSLELARALGDRRGEANALGNLGVVCAGLGQKVAAMVYYQRAVELARRIGHGRAEWHNLNNLGEAWRERGKHEWALACYLLAVQVGQAVSDPGVPSTEQNILLLKQELAEEQFAALLHGVEPKSEEIVKRSLRTIARVGRTVCAKKASTGGSRFREN